MGIYMYMLHLHVQCNKLGWYNGEANVAWVDHTQMHMYMYIYSTCIYTLIVHTGACIQENQKWGE